MGALSTEAKMMTSRETLVYQAKLAEQAERYDEMVDFMRQVALEAGELSVEERNLLSVAYKNAVGARRASWRVIASIEEKEKEKPDSEDKAMHTQMIAEYKAKTEKELGDMCHSILDVLDQHLIPKSSGDEAKIFHYKMKGDYYRYLAEVGGENAKVNGDSAMGAYKVATDTAAATLPATHPIRLGLALNFSVFYYEILKQSDQAVAVAKNAFDQAIQDLDNVAEESYKDSTLIMQLLRDNLNLWTQPDQN
eukprot:c15416_g1_i2.p1 GENE.c15416_g1_i2~~c15416_g1_i2.p1  ORF type:complete len:251 (-),score=53.83 c15416_g1_i2:83-835(-)